MGRPHDRRDRCVNISPTTVVAYMGTTDVDEHWLAWQRAGDAIE